MDKLSGPLFVSRVKQLSEDEIQALVTAKLENSVTNQRLQEMLTSHRVDITHTLKKLVDAEMLETHGHGRGTYYTLAEPRTVQPSLFDSSADDSSLHKDDSSLHKDDSSLHKSDSSLHNEEHLKDLASPVSGTKRADPALIEQTILSLCQDQFLTLQQIAHLLNRTPDNLRTRYLSPLLVRRKLKLRYPDKPNHSQQGYKTQNTRGES